MPFSIKYGSVCEGHVFYSLPLKTFPSKNECRRVPHTSLGVSSTPLRDVLVVFGSLHSWTAGVTLTRDPHVQFSATLTKAVAHLRSIQSGMRLLLNLPKVSPGQSMGWALDLQVHYVVGRSAATLCMHSLLFYWLRFAGGPRNVTFSKSTRYAFSLGKESRRYDHQPCVSFISAWPLPFSPVTFPVVRLSWGVASSYTTHRTVDVSTRKTTTSATFIGHVASRVHGP